MTFFRSCAMAAALAAALVALPAFHAHAQENDLAGALTDLLRGGAATQKRVPFGREEVQLSFAPLVKDTAPAVVNVYASSKTQVQSPFMGDPFFEQFFGQQMPPRVQSSLGSGVMVDPSGIVVTNFHVIRDADEVKVATADGREFTSRLMLKDESLDLAVLKIDAPEPFPVVAIGDSDALEVGDLVLAIGNPFGVGQTTTSGIVSALARSHIGVSDFGFFIQTDAAINPGNSGGALINMNGQLIGINTAIYSRSGGSIGIGFAIPSNMVRAVVASAQAGNDFFERPYIGATFEPVTADVAEALGLDKPVGALVSSVDEAGPSARAGLKAGDIVTALNGTAIEHVDALGYRLATLSIGATAQLTVFSKGGESAMDITLERAPEGSAPAQVAIDGSSPIAGATVAAVSPRLSQRLRLHSGAKGVAIVDIARNSPAAGFGFLPRDIVLEVNGAEISSAEQLKEAAMQDTRTWRFTVDRDGQILRQILRY